MPEGASHSRKRPVWVWVISIFFFIFAGGTLLSFLLIGTGALHLASLQQAYFDSLSKLDYSLSIAIGLADLIGAITLLLLRKIAFYLFLGALTVNLFMSVWHALTKGWIGAIGGGDFLAAIMSLAISIAVCAYTWKLVKRGVLF